MVKLWIDTDGNLHICCEEIIPARALKDINWNDVKRYVLHDIDKYAWTYCLNDNMKQSHAPVIEKEDIVHPPELPSVCAKCEYRAITPSVKAKFRICAHELYCGAYKEWQLEQKRWDKKTRKDLEDLLGGEDNGTDDN